MPTPGLPNEKVGIDWLMSQPYAADDEPISESKWMQLAMSWPLWLPPIPQVRQTVEMRRFLTTSAARTALIPFLLAANETSHGR